MNLKISGKSRSIYLTKREDIVIIKKQSLLCFFSIEKCTIGERGVVCKGFIHYWSTIIPAF